MDEPLTGAVEPTLLPRGVAVGYSGQDAGALWHKILTLPGGRIGLALGRNTHPCDTERGHALADVLLTTGDPRRALDMLATGSSAVCAVITPADCAMRYGIRAGDSPEPLIAVARPRTAAEPLGAPHSTEASLRLPPGSTLLLCSRADGRVVGLLGEGSGEPPQRCAEMLTASLAEAEAGPDMVALYRCAPEPLELTMRAEPKNLAAVRDRLRRWLGLAGVDPESTADTLLAVGEAASNCSEHAVAGVSHPVEFTVRAAIDGRWLRCTVSDNGHWKPAPAPDSEARSHRGHGIKLIKALVDNADVTTGEHGTTVEMLKELRS